MQLHRRFQILSAILATVAILAVAQGSPEIRHWKTIGPGGGGALFSPTISPRNPNRILVASDMTGSYISDDGGASWRMFNLRGQVHFFVFDPQNNDVIYAQSLGLWRSSDGAHTWNLIHPLPGQVVSVAMADDHASERLITSRPTPQVTALAIDPADSKILYATMDLEHRTALYKSIDTGASWTPLHDISGEVHAIYIDSRSPREDRNIYLITDNAVYTFSKGNLRQGQPAPEVKKFSSISLGWQANARQPIIYTSSGGDILISEDSGTTWRRSQFPLNGAHIRAIVSSADHAEIAYASYSTRTVGWFGKTETWFGVAKTTDRGHNWDLIWKDSEQKSSESVHDGWIGRYFGPNYGGNPIALTVSANDPNLVYSTDTARIMRTTDGGKSWQALYSSEQSDSGYSGRGLENTTSYGVHFDPFNSQRIFVSYTDIGLLRSEDGGRSWLPSMRGVPQKWQNTAYWMIFDPKVRGRAWAVMSATHDLPRAKMWSRKSPEAYQGGVMISDDGGNNWRQSSVGLPLTAPTHILLDPFSPPSARVLYITAFGRGVYKSVDGGRSWSLKTTGISQPQPFAWRLARDAEGTLYLIVVRKSVDGSIADESDGGVYRSTDAAEHWTRLSLPAGVNGPNGIAIDPRDPRRLYLAAWARNKGMRGEGGGIYLSKDGGRTWKNVLSLDQHIYDITIDPREPQILYAAGFEAALWRSSDRGSSWHRLPGFNFQWGHRVIVDPADPDAIYVTTFGGGVWHGPAKGDPHWQDEIATPALSHTKQFPLPSTGPK
jgi:photosystem II stability/assembly factor-like uncharacterized protein